MGAPEAGMGQRQSPVGWRNGPDKPGNSVAAQNSPVKSPSTHWIRRGRSGAGKNAGIVHPAPRNSWSISHNPALSGRTHPAPRNSWSISHCPVCSGRMLPGIPGAFPMILHFLGGPILLPRIPGASPIVLSVLRGPILLSEIPGTSPTILDFLGGPILLLPGIPGASPTPLAPAAAWKIPSGLFSLRFSLSLLQISPFPHQNNPNFTTGLEPRWRGSFVSPRTHPQKFREEEERARAELQEAEPQKSDAEIIFW